MNERYRVIPTPINKDPYPVPTLKIENKPTDLKIRTMHFDNSVFHKGLNMTVRLGSKWYEFLDVGGWFKPQGFQGYAKVRELQLRKFIQCKDWHILENEHDPGCKSFEGLREVLGKAYPEFAQASINEQDVAEVTVVGFVIYRPWI